MDDRTVKLQIKTLFSQTALYGIGDIGTKLLNLILIPVHVSFLSIQEYSVYSLFILFYSFSLTVYLFGINSGFLRYYLDDEFDKNKVFSTAFLFLSGFTVIVSLIVILLNGWFAEVLFDTAVYKDIFYYGVVILICESLSTIALLVFRAQNNPAGFIAAVIVKVSTILITNVIFLIVLHMGLYGAVLGNLCGSAALLLMSSPVIIKHIRLKFSCSIFKKMFLYGIPAVPAVFSITILIMIDQYLLKHFGYFDKVGIYAVGYKIGMALTLLISGFKLAWFPFVFQTAKQVNAKKIFSGVFTYFNFFLILFYLIICIYIPLVFKYIFPVQYYESVKLIPFIGLGYIFSGWYENFMVGVYIKDKTLYVALVIAFAALVNICLNFILIPRYVMYGAAAATAVSYFVLMVSGYFISRKYYRIHYNFLNAGKTLLAASLVMVVYYYYSNTYLNIFLPFLFVLLLFLTGFFNKEEKQMIKEFFRK